MLLAALITPFTTAIAKLKNPNADMADSDPWQSSGLSCGKNTTGISSFLWYKKNIRNWARCFKIAEKVSFNITSKTSYLYNLSGQKVRFVEFLKTRSFRSNSFARKVNFNWKNICGKCHILKNSNGDILGDEVLLGSFHSVVMIYRLQLVKALFQNVIIAWQWRIPLKNSIR